MLAVKGFQARLLAPMLHRGVLLLFYANFYHRMLKQYQAMLVHVWSNYVRAVMFWSILIILEQELMS